MLRVLKGLVAVAAILLLASTIYAQAGTNYGGAREWTKDEKADFIAVTLDRTLQDFLTGAIPSRPAMGGELPGSRLAAIRVDCPAPWLLSGVMNHEAKRGCNGDLFVFLPWPEMCRKLKAGKFLCSPVDHKLATVIILVSYLRDKAMQA